MAKVVGDGKVTIPLRVRDVLGTRDGDYVRTTLTEIVKRKSQRRSV